MWLFCTNFMIRDSTSWESHKDKNLCYYSARSAHQIGIFKKSLIVNMYDKTTWFLVLYIESWQYLEGSIIQAAVSYTWNKLKPLCIRNICNINHTYCYLVSLTWNIQLCSCKNVIIVDLADHKCFWFIEPFMPKYFSVNNLMKNTFFMGKYLFYYSIS